MTPCVVVSTWRWDVMRWDLPKEMRTRWDVRYFAFLIFHPEWTHFNPFSFSHFPPLHCRSQYLSHVSTSVHRLVLVKDFPHCRLAVKPDCETRKRIIKIAPIVCTATVFVSYGGGRRTKLLLSQWAVVRLSAWHCFHLMWGLLLEWASTSTSRWVISHFSRFEASSVLCRLPLSP